MACCLNPCFHVKTGCASAGRTSGHFMGEVVYLAVFRSLQARHQLATVHGANVPFYVIARSAAGGPWQSQSSHFRLRSLLRAKRSNPRMRVCFGTLCLATAKLLAMTAQTQLIPRERLRFLFVLANRTLMFADGLRDQICCILGKSPQRGNIFSHYQHNCRSDFTCDFLYHTAPEIRHISLER